MGGVAAGDRAECNGVFHPRLGLGSGAAQGGRVLQAERRRHLEGDPEAEKIDIGYDPSAFPVYVPPEPFGDDGVDDDEDFAGDDGAQADEVGFAPDGVEKLR